VIKAGMESRIILGIGSGRCGTRSLADVLNRQPGCRVTHEERPLLAWDADQLGERLRARFARWRKRRDAGGPERFSFRAAQPWEVAG